MIIFILLLGLEIALAFWTCTKGKEKEGFRKKRFIVRVAQVVIVIIAMLLPFGQKWRFVPILAFLTILLVISVLAILFKGNQTDSIKKTPGVVISCILCIMVFSILFVPAFLFTGYQGLPVSGEYRIGESSAILIDSSRTDPFEKDGSFREVPVHFYYPETGESDVQQFPLVLFSHGAFGYYQSNTSTYRELASNGYVVVALDHPHHAFFTKNTDGKMVIVDQAFLKQVSEQNSEDSIDSNAEDRLEIYQDWMSLRTADMGFVVDELKRTGHDGVMDESWFIQGHDSDTIPGILKMMDTSRIGLMGHSMGGATSVALGRVRNDVAAVIDLDGTMLSEYTGIVNGKFTVNENPYEVPLLEFVNWETYNELAEHMEEYRAEGSRYPNDELMRHATVAYTTTIRDTRHMDFTDLPLLSPVLGNILGSGVRDKEEVMNIINSLVLQFFNCYLKGEGSFTIQDIY